MPLRPLQWTSADGLLCQRGTPAQNYQALGIVTAAGTGKCFHFRDTVHRAARKVTGLISLVQGCGTADNCLAWGSPSSTAQCCRRKVKEGEQMVSSNDSYKTPCRLCHTAALSPNKQLSHTATPLDSGSWELLLFQLLKSISQSPGPGEGVCWMLQAQQEGPAPKTFTTVPVFLSCKFEQKSCCTLNVTARQKGSNESPAVFPTS